MPYEVIITFVVYLLFLLGVGFYFYRRSVTIEDYLLGGRRMGAWVTALSAQASDMSGWLLMGLPGALYAGGLVEAWIAIGLFAGTLLNWLLVAGRLRVYTEKTGAITLPCFFESRFKDPTGLLRVVSAIVILIFFTIYASSGLVASGRLFESIFTGVDYRLAVLVGGLIIVGYTFMGGFLAVCWTDLFQGLLMLVALVVVPIAACREIGGLDGLRHAMEVKQVATSLFGHKDVNPTLAIVSSAAWGLGYFGQPHILVRFMGARSVVKVRQSATIAMVWVFLSLGGAVLAGLAGIGMFEDLPKYEQDKVFIYMIGRLFHPWLAGVLLAAILSAIMSTIDSQLLVSSSALAEDFYQKVIRRDASRKQVIVVGRMCVIAISLVALVLAMNPNRTIMEIVSYAWGGFGAAFGPLVLFALFSRRTGWQGALGGMVVGAVVVVAWKQAGWGDYMYEIVPGFLANCLTIVIVNFFAPQRNAEVVELYGRVDAAVRQAG